MIEIKVWLIWITLNKDFVKAGTQGPLLPYLSLSPGYFLGWIQRMRANLPFWSLLVKYLAKTLLKTVVLTVCAHPYCILTVHAIHLALIVVPHHALSACAEEEM